MPTPLLRSPGKRLLACLIGLLVLAAGVGQARAADADPAVLEKITKLNKRAVDAYQDLNFDESRKLLKEAVDTAEGAGLENHPANARTYVHLGVVVLAGFKQKDEAVKLFRKALQIQPDIKLDRSLANPEIQEVYDEAVAAQKSEPATSPAGGGITHEPVIKSARGAPILIKAEVETSLGAKKLVISFKADGADEFGTRDMREDPAVAGSWAGEIPASATQGAKVEYFIEAFGDNEEKALATNGTEESPLTVALLERRKREPKPQAKEEAGNSWFIGLGIGSGIGWTTGKGDVNAANKIDPPGLAPSTAAHLTPELGYYLSPSTFISLQLRLQLVTGVSTYYATGNECGTDGICSAAWHAEAALARFGMFLSEGSFRPYVAGVAGGGQIRHVAKFASITNCGMNHDETCVDSVAAGPVFVGGGLGFFYDVSSSFALQVGTNILVGFPTFTAHADLNAGVAVMF